MQESFKQLFNEIESYRLEMNRFREHLHTLKRDEEAFEIGWTTMQEKIKEIKFQLLPWLSEITSFSKLVNQKSYSSALSNGIIPPPYSEWAESFAFRYAIGEISDFKDDYLKDEEVLSSLMVLGIKDIYKFYFFLLWLKDYVEGLTIDALQLTSRPIDDINKLISGINTLFTEESDRYDLPVANGSLEFRLNNKRDCIISNPYTIKIIGKALQEYCNNHKKCNISDGNSDSQDLYYRKEMPKPFIDADSLLLTPSVKGNSSSTIQYFIFHHYMRIYLDSKDAQKGTFTLKDFFQNTEHPTYKVDKDKDWTISRLLCISGMADMKTYYNTNKRALRDNIKGVTWESYKKLNLSNSRY